MVSFPVPFTDDQIDVDTDRRVVEMTEVATMLAPADAAELERLIATS